MSRLEPLEDVVVFLSARMGIIPFEYGIQCGRRWLVITGSPVGNAESGQMGHLDSE